MTDKIKAGDVVRLKSGSQKMIVARLEGVNDVDAVCGWAVNGKID
jgi:uncharacterized protein YodC (DUF2158 family)